MTKSQQLAVLCFAVLPTSTAYAQTGEQVLIRCLPAVKELEGQKISREESEAARWCIGYLSGMIDGITLMTSHLPSKKICFPKDGLSTYQSVKVVTDWLRANPKDLNESGRTSVVVALGTAFPCSK